MANEGKILIIEDDKKICSFVSTILESNGYTPINAGSGNEGISLAASHTPVLIVLDLGLPDMDGIKVLQQIRKWSDIPIIVLSARQNENEKVTALDAGANDYVTKPFGNDELIARIRSSIRIYNRMKSPYANLIFENGSLRIDYEKRLVSIENNNIHLTPVEYKIIVLLAQNAGRVMTHDQIINQLWGPFSSDNQILRVNVANIRRKIEKNPADPQYITTEIGVGYRMTELNT